MERTRMNEKYEDIEVISRGLKLEGKPFAVFDFESSKSENNIPGNPIQIGALIYDKNHKVSLLSKYIEQKGYDPETDMINTKKMFKSITDLTGITKANLEAPEFADQRIQEKQIMDYNLPSMLLIGYNVNYDSNLLREVYRKNGEPIQHIEILDVMAIFIDLYGNVPGMIKKGCNRFGIVYYEDYKLEQVSEKLGVMEDGEVQTHQGFDDVWLTVRVLKKIVEDHQDLDFTRYINKIYFNPCYEIPNYLRLTSEGVSYYPFGTNKKEGRIWQSLTLYNYNNFDLNNF